MVGIISRRLRPIFLSAMFPRIKDKRGAEFFALVFLTFPELVLFFVNGR